MDGVDGDDISSLLAPGVGVRDNEADTTENIARTGTNPATPVGEQPNPPLPSTTGKKRKPNAGGNKTTSVAWDHFEKIVDPNGGPPSAKCKYCPKTYFCDPKTHGTKSMLNHIPVCPKFPNAVTNHPSETVLNFEPNRSGGSSSVIASSDRFNLESSERAVAMFVLLDEQPFKAVEGEGFKYLFRHLQPQMEPPSKFTVARDCLKIYQEEKVRLKALFRSNSSRVSLTTECWTSIQNLNYVTVTAHFIDNDWKYEKRIISFSLIPNHKGDTIGKHVEDVLREWGLKNISTITVDNASSNDVAVAYLKKKLKNMGGLVLDGKFFHIRCCAHILNLVVVEALKDQRNSIASIRSAVTFVRSSLERLAKFKECVDFANIHCQKLLCLDVPSRWNSTYLMLDVALQYQLAFHKLEEDDNVGYLNSFVGVGAPTREDWDNARAFVQFLKLFFDATNTFSKNLHVSIHSVFHQLASIHDELQASCMNVNFVLANMGIEMKRKYEKYLGNPLNMNHLLYIGVSLDPRYKLSYVLWSFDEMYKNNPQLKAKLSCNVKKSLFEMYAWYVAAHEEQMRGALPSGGPLEGSSNAVNAGPAETPLYKSRTDAYMAHVRQQNYIEQRNELQRFLSEGVLVDAGKKFDLLLWWKQNSSRFPILSKMVKDVLATPVSTFASDSVFSTEGRVLDSFRSSLTPEMVEGLICGQNWLRPFVQQFNELNVYEELENSAKVV